MRKSPCNALSVLSPDTRGQFALGGMNRRPLPTTMLKRLLSPWDDAAALTDAKRHHNSKPYTQRLAELIAGAAGGAAGGDGAGQGGAAAEDGDAAAAAAGAGAAAAAAAAGPMLW